MLSSGKKNSSPNALTMYLGMVSLSVYTRSCDHSEGSHDSHNIPIGSIKSIIV